jgi:signal transduction histidine kinase
VSESPVNAPLAHLRHELCTPVNHILGFAELLAEDARERRLGARLPSMERIQQGGRQLLEVIETTLGDSGAALEDSALFVLKSGLREAATGTLEAASALRRTLDERESETLADLDAIEQALYRLLAFAAQEGSLDPLESSHRAPPPNGRG